MKKPKIGVCVSSRGTMFSKTMESVWNNCRGKNVELYMSHNLPIPICFNYTLQRAMNDGCDYIWFVEEDMLIPDGTLDRLLEEDTYVIGVDYADRRTGKGLTKWNKKGECLYTGMGCLLLKREVFERLEKPWLKRCVFWIVETDDGDIDYVPHPEIPCTGYGTQDVYLCYTLRAAGFKVIVLRDIKVGHMQLNKKAEDVVSHGIDFIQEIYIEENSKNDTMSEIGRNEQPPEELIKIALRHQ